MTFPSRDNTSGGGKGKEQAVSPGGRRAENLFQAEVSPLETEPGRGRRALRSAWPQDKPRIEAFSFVGTPARGPWIQMYGEAEACQPPSLPYGGLILSMAQEALNELVTILLTAVGRGRVPGVPLAPRAAG